MSDGPEHDHRHDHDAQEFQPDLEDTMPHSDHQFLETAVRELLIEKGLITADGIRAAMEAMDARGPHQGAQVVARAWADPHFKARLIADPGPACRELGVDIGPLKLIVVENTPALHNVVVCTLCSCYPRYLLGIPPLWYKSRDYRSRVVREPRAVLVEFGTTLGGDVEIRVHDSTADMRYLVLPMRPDGTEGMSEGELAAMVTRDSMIGVTLPAAPRRAAAE